MNYLKKQSENRRLLNCIRSSNKCGSHEGCLRIWRGCTHAHELAKFEVCFKLINDGWSVFTEAIFTNGNRADIVAIKGGVGIIVEILESEYDKVKNLSSNPRESKYPIDFEFYQVKSDKAYEFLI
jgi:hypothetical protein